MHQISSGSMKERKRWEFMRDGDGDVEESEFVCAMRCDGRDEIDMKKMKYSF
jgi:hypothetical protein